MTYQDENLTRDELSPRSIPPEGAHKLTMWAGHALVSHLTFLIAKVFREKPVMGQVLLS